MRVLQLCKKFPYPLKDGESIAVTYFSQAMYSLGATYDLLSMNTSKHYCEVAELPASFNHYRQVWTVDIDNRIKPLAALGNLFSHKSFHIERFVSDDFKAQLITILRSNEYDIIQLETLYLTPYIDVIRQHSKAKIVMRSHNVEFEIWERLAKNEQNWLKKQYLKYLTSKLEHYEIAQLSKVDAILAITERDLAQYRHLGFNKNGKIVPIGLDMDAYECDLSSYQRPMSISFIGSLDWQPNLEGVRWFLDNAWTTIHNTFPDLTFHIAGRNTPPELKQLQLPNVIIHGEVPDARAFIAAHSLMLVPLLSGGGMRAKILEGMALGKVVLSTSVGIEGIPVVNGKQAFIADDVEAITKALHQCYALGNQLQSIGENAHHFIQDHYDNKVIAQRVLAYYDKMINGKKIQTALV